MPQFNVVIFVVYLQRFACFYGKTKHLVIAVEAMDAPPLSHSA